MSITFATTCWERDWRRVLLDPEYLPRHQIDRHCYRFAEKLLVINDVNNLSEVALAAEKKIKEGVLTRYVVAEEAVLAHFNLKREDFKGDHARDQEFVYYNALGPLTAILACRTEYILFHMGDVWVDAPCRWIDQALELMRKDPSYKIANITWDGRYFEAKSESFKKDGEFFVSNGYFSDQMFLAKTADLLAPIYGEEREDALHFPGDTFERRLFCAMRNRGWRRLTYDGATYIHRNIHVS